MSTSIDQQRAAYAWQCASKRRGVARYREQAKGASALVMGSGLMAALAFWQSRTDKNKAAAHALVEDLLGWFASRKPLSAGFERLGADKRFEPAMNLMARADSAQYMALTDEALALLRWLRQFADALKELS